MIFSIIHRKIKNNTSQQTDGELSTLKHQILDCIKASKPKWMRAGYQHQRSLKNLLRWEKKMG